MHEYCCHHRKRFKFLLNHILKFRDKPLSDYLNIQNLITTMTSYNNLGMSFLYFQIKTE